MGPWRNWHRAHRSILKSRDESDQFSTSRPIALRQHDQLGEFSTRSNRYCISRTVGLFGGLRAIIHAGWVYRIS
jgi:hypothetical protein